ncbi:MAG: ATP-binding protein, partial [Flavihumibacter sp.]
TPIAVAKLNLETLQKHKLEESRQQKLIRMTLQETNRLNDLTNNILISSQLEAGGYKKVFEETDLSQLCHAQLQLMQSRYPDNRFESAIESNVKGQVDALLIQILINNLLDNAVKYAPKNEPIVLGLERKPGEVVIKVSDLGPGIPKEEKTRIFQRFYRIGNESVRKTKGTGLGLYLCRKIAADHHGSVTVSDNLPNGTIFTINLPLQDA